MGRMGWGTDDDGFEITWAEVTAAARGLVAKM